MLDLTNLYLYNLTLPLLHGVLFTVFVEFLSTCRIYTCESILTRNMSAPSIALILSAEPFSNYDILFELSDNVSHSNSVNRQSPIYSG